MMFPKENVLLKEITLVHSFRLLMLTRDCSTVYVPVCFNDAHQNLLGYR